jgi:hypothetical protein
MNPDLIWRILSGALGLGNVLSQGKQTREYEGDQDQQIADALGVASQVGPQTMNVYDDSAGQQLGSLEQVQRDAQRGTQSLYRNTASSRGEFLRDLDSRSRELLSGYQDRYNTAQKDIEGYGRQMAEDIDTGAARERGEFQLNPLSRGSTVSRSVNQNIEDARSANQRRLGEDLTRQRVNLLSGLSGDTLSAQGNLDASRAAFDSALRGQLLDTQRYGFETNQNAQGNIGNFYGANAINRSGLANQGMNTYLNTLTGINLVPPPPQDLQGLGAGLIQPVQPQVSGWEAFLGGAAGGVGQGIGTGLAMGW